MSHRLRIFEDSPTSRRAARRAEAALLRLQELARRDSESAEFVTTLLEGVAEQAELRGQRASLPGRERAIWVSVGARFDDSHAAGQVRARRAAAFADLVQRSIAGDAAVAKVLGVDRTRVSQRLSQRSVYAFQGPEGRHFPLWQFRDGRPLPGLGAVLSGIDRRVHPLVVDHWFTSPNVDLVVEEAPVSPVEWLATGGDPELVAELAAEL